MRDDDVAETARGQAYGRIRVAGERASLSEREGAAVGTVVCVHRLIGGRCTGALAEPPVGSRRVRADRARIAAALPLVGVGDRLRPRPAAGIGAQRLPLLGGAG